MAGEKCIIGIDPGFEGALAFYQPPDGLIDFWTMRSEAIPTVSWTGKPRPGKRKMRRHYEYDEGPLADLFAGFHSGNCHVFLEKQQAMTRFDPHKFNEQTQRLGMNVPPAVQSTFNLAGGYFWFRGLLAALRIPYTLVPPKEWQREMFIGMGDAAKDTKKTAHRVANHLYPELDLRKSQRARIAHEGKCDAILIATYGFHKLYGRLRDPQLHMNRR